MKNFECFIKQVYIWNSERNALIWSITYVLTISRDHQITFVASWDNSCGIFLCIYQAIKVIAASKNAWRQAILSPLYYFIDENHAFTRTIKTYKSIVIIILQNEGQEKALSKKIIKFDLVDQIKLNVFIYKNIKILEYLNRINNMIYHSQFRKAIISFPNL